MGWKNPGRHTTNRYPHINARKIEYNLQERDTYSTDILTLLLDERSPEEFYFAVSKGISYVILQCYIEKKRSFIHERKKRLIV